MITQTPLNPTVIRRGRWDGSKQKMAYSEDGDLGGINDFQGKSVHRTPEKASELKKFPSDRSLSPIREKVKQGLQLPERNFA